MKRSLYLIILSTLFGSAHCQSLKEIFTHAYKNPQWGGYPETVSGPGSTLASTIAIQKGISHIFKTYPIKTMLNAPCGDENWIRAVDMSNLTLYIGVDIVEDLIEKNRSLYQTEPGEFPSRVFLSRNIVQDAFPCVDLILCRDCFIHLSYQDIFSALKNFKNSGSTYLLVSTYRNATQNRDTTAPSNRQLNLQLPPFNFPEPLEIIDEHDSTGPGKSLALWKFEDLPDFE